MKVLRISESEWCVMEVLWETSPLSSQDIIKSLGAHAWKPQTIKTLLGRLVKKEALEYEMSGNRYFYSPAIGREDALSEETQSFLSRICRNSLMPMLNHSIESKRRLSAEEVQAMRDLLAEQEEKE